MENIVNLKPVLEYKGLYIFKSYDGYRCPCETNNIGSPCIKCEICPFSKRKNNEIICKKTIEKLINKQKILNKWKTL